MTQDERFGRDASIAGGEKEIDALYSTLARLIGEAFKPYREQEELRLMDYPALKRKLTKALETVFGRRKGDQTAPLYGVLVKHAEAEWYRIFDANAKEARRHLQRDPELHEAVEQVARSEATPRVVPDATTWKDPKGRTLIDRVWLARTTTWDRIDQELRIGIVMKERPAQLALRIQRWISPAQSHTRNRVGVLQ